ncbi:PadR family transcriptional regulator [Halioglobus maricola]|uniref:PadR family transcriptional regulator n=1 Tax=Halioglobus maricola TaxID=2601894 RepID=A0A5P9NI70_9GAMM|nr:PadR family transcriptional regulator [Halioglobus maricola]QFU75235.1 PadR family transcriptional regulator [Halioglobus maricola]
MALAQAIMTSLLDADLSGSELARDFEKSMGFFWQASHQQIYQELRKLAEKGWLNKREVNQSGRPNKIVYGLTMSGREALADWVFGPTKVQATKDELLLKLYNLTENNVEHMVGEISRRREEVMQRLYLYEAIRRRHYAAPEDLPVRHKGVFLALQSGIHQGEQFLTWCDEAMQLLGTVEKVDSTPAT